MGTGLVSDSMNQPVDSVTNTSAQSKVGEFCGPSLDSAGLCKDDGHSVTFEATSSGTEEYQSSSRPPRT